MTFDFRTQWIDTAHDQWPTHASRKSFRLLGRIATPSTHEVNQQSLAIQSFDLFNKLPFFHSWKERYFWYQRVWPGKLKTLLKRFNHLNILNRPRTDENSTPDRLFLESKKHWFTWLSSKTKETLVKQMRYVNQLISAIVGVADCLLWKQWDEVRHQLGIVTSVIRAGAKILRDFNTW